MYVGPNVYEYRFTKQAVRAVSPTCPENVHLWRCSSHATIRRCLLAHSEALLDPLAGLCQTSHPQVHLHLLARQRWLRLVYVPPRMTPVLQPCGSHVFEPACKRRRQPEPADAVHSSASTKVQGGFWEP